MSLALLDGTNAAIDVSINSNSYKAIIGVWSARLSREFFEQTTFASGGWRQRIPGMKQCLINMAGFASKSSAISDPSVLIGSQAPFAGVFTADTGSTISGNFHIGSDDLSFVAAGNSGRVIQGESSGVVTVVWVTV